MNSKSISKIALISFHADPAIAIDNNEGNREGIYVNGQSVYVGSLGVELSKLGLKVDMYTRKILPNQPLIVQHNDNLRTIRFNAGPEHFIHRDELFQHLPTFLDNLLNYTKDMDSRYDIIHTNYWMSGWVGLRLKELWDIKHAHTNHSLGIVKYDVQGKNPTIFEKRLSIEKQLLECTDVTIATCPEERAILEKIFDRGRIEMLPCAIDVDRFTRFSRNEARGKLNLTDKENIVLYVGRLDPRKGIRTLIEAIKLLNVQGHLNLKLLIVGDNLSEDLTVKNEFAQLTKLIRESKIENIISFVGPIYYENMPVYYNAADVCVVPSHYEPFGLVAIEAMASGTPVVASNVGGLKYSIVHGKTGLLFEPQDSSGLANSIESIVTNHKHKEFLGLNARSRAVENFNISHMVKGILDIYMCFLTD